MKNSEYWKLRFKQLENAANTSASETLSFVDEQYKAAVKDIESQISIWYSRFAKNNGITIQEARQWLSSKQLKELQWDVDEYIKYGQENGLNAGWMKELENASAKFHISKLEALKMQTQMTCDKLFGSQLGAVGKMAKKTYLDGYYHSAYEIQKGLNVGWDIAGIDENKLLKVIGKPWTTDGKNFSERIWLNRSNLISETHKQLTQDILLGRSPDDSIKAISKKFSTSKSQAGRLVMTESAYFSSEAQKDCFNELDVEQFEVVETLDGTTCEICGSMDGQVFDMKDFEPGTTAPPFHPWCRGCTVPHFDDNFTERAARNNEGKTYYVPSDVKYEDWKKSFVDADENMKDGLTKNNSSDRIKSIDKQLKTLEIEQTDLLGGCSYKKLLEDGWDVQDYLDADEYKRFTSIQSEMQMLSEERNQLLPISANNANVSKIAGYNFNEGTSATQTSHIGTADCYDLNGVRFIYPESYSIKDQVIEPQRAMGLFDKLPNTLKNEVHTIEFLDYKNPQDSYWAKRYKWKGFTSFATGSNGHIAFWKNGISASSAMDDNWIFHTFAHESAHTLDQTLGSNGKRFSNSSMWKKIVNEDLKHSGKKSPTSYGETNLCENFADSIAKYCADPTAFEKEFPNRAKYFKGVL